MKLSDFLFNVGRPVAFYPGLVKALGSMKQAVFICQMAYWKDKSNDPDGWIYKTADEIETETSLTYKEQTTVRAALVEKKLLQERYARTEHQMYFRVNWDAVNDVWDKHLTNGHMLQKVGHLTNGKVAPSQRSGGILPKGGSLNSNTEITQKTTQIEGAGIDWMLGHGQTPTEEELKQTRLREEAPKMFEKALGFGTLPWGSNSVWVKFQKFVTDIYLGDQLAFGNYLVWRGDKGKYKAMSNKQIRMNPQVFMDTGWWEFAGQPSSAPLPQETPEELAARRAEADRLFGVQS